MNTAAQDFISREPRTFRFKIGRLLASSLAGFIAGMVVASVVWLAGVWYVQQVQNIPSPRPAVIAPTS